MELHFVSPSLDNLADCPPATADLIRQLADIFPLDRPMPAAEFRLREVRMLRKFSDAAAGYPEHQAHLLDIRLGLLASGFRPIAVYSWDHGEPQHRGKRPRGEAWQNTVGLPEFGSDRYLNTGILTAGLRAIDLDLDDAGEAARARDIVLEVLGDTPLIRTRANSPRVLLLYGAAEGEPAKRQRPVGNGKVEVMGAGQQVVAYGTHATGAAIEWQFNAPHLVPIEDVPRVTEAQIGELLDRMAHEIPAGDKPGGERQEKKSSGLGFDFGTGENTNDKTARLISEILLGASYHDALRDLAAQFASDGVPPNRIEAMLYGFMDSAERVPTPDEPNRWANRRAQIPELVASAWAKFGPKAEAAGETEGAAQPGRLKPTPFVWREPAQIPRREWLYGRHYIRKYLTATVAPGGVGKTALALGEAIDMVTGRGIFHDATPLRVWYWNGEDPADEIERRVAAFMLHHRLAAADMSDRLFLDSGRSAPLKLVRDSKEGAIAQPEVEQLIEACRENRIDVLICDPFVATHSVGENDNAKIEVVTAQFKRVADVAGVAVELIHHVRKAQMGQGDYTVEDARGAKALIDAARSVRVLNVMSKDEGEAVNLDDLTRRLHFRIDNGKSNMAPPADRATWRRLVDVALGNGGLTGDGDHVQAVDTFDMPGAMDDVTERDLSLVQNRIGAERYGYDVQSADWIGDVIADVLGLDVQQTSTKKKIKRLIKVWLASGALKLVTEHDKRGKRDRKFVRCGNLN